jgi:hypothetical protein
MDRTPGSFDTATLLNHARQSERASQRTKMTQSPPPSLLSKPLPSTPRKVTAQSGTFGRNKLLRSTSLRQSFPLPRLCLQCSGSPENDATNAPGKRSCPSCQSLASRVSDQRATDPIAILRPLGGTDTAAGNCVDSPFTPATTVTRSASALSNKTSQKNRHSWISLSNHVSPATSITGSHSASTTVVADEDISGTKQLLRTKPAMAASDTDCEESNDTLDLAFFLKTTGPPPQIQRDHRKLRRLIALSKFRKRHQPIVPAGNRLVFSATLLSGELTKYKAYKRFRRAPATTAKSYRKYPKMVRSLTNMLVSC